MQDADPRIAHHYDELAALWDDIVADPSRERLLWETLDGMLPDLDGKHVLDAGCGSGFYAERYVDRGADVTGVDLSEDMLDRARQQVPDAEFVQADLGESLDFLDDDSVDVVVCQHVFSHLPDLSGPLSEFARVLVDGGVLVVSTHNPVHDYVVVREGEYPTETMPGDMEATVETESATPVYDETERYDIIWNSGPDSNRATYYRRSIEGLFSPVLDAGFEIRDVVEPTPDEAFTRENPEIAAGFKQDAAKSVCLKAVR
ncbi:class I SAM-dependent methyltransferase [Haloarchaeobius sp. HME9146]|uniref:class I SAM-dependent methyltransferase n=1 Tax=Haloarchaeobius sp. HME9146 TaxID=2978732 RepID=UPI0021BF72D6|nr:class I SAM-dependent methyltransferase [Haloarchaeobius sp. HME9146]MCT9097851.1 class I SAM-dependent methyltransferase [Haloarchaeobius sp. HME9146]